ncbi:MAG: bifunctional diguanylate cyclase/phosphodiesterase [Rubrivivax sp.]
MDGAWPVAAGWTQGVGALLLAAGALAWAWAWHRRRPLARSAAAVASVERDPLTGLPTRSAFEEAMDDATHRADVEQRPLALLVLGLDDFRIVNEAYGHAVGDRVLQAVPERIAAALPQALQSTRIAGDEFALALWADGAEAQCAADRLLAQLRRPHVLDGQTLALDASVGIALYPQHGARPRLLLHAASAMSAVKRAGGGGHATFEPSMAVDVRQQAELLRDLRQAVAQGQLQLVYQPKIDARSLQVTAAEALLRWQHPTRGCIAPSVFIPLAERHGLIAELGRWVIDEATRQAGEWRAQGLNMRVAVNLSAVQLRQDDGVDHLLQCLQKHGVPPTRFTCEITESVAMEDTRVTRAAFARLGDAGIHVSIDDFGTGHSSLATLRQLPAAELKIDRAFVTDLATSPEARSIASAVIRMAHLLGLRVVAEGVETEAQRDWLVAEGCDELQGWLFARPMPPHLLAVWASGEQGPAPIAFRDSLFRDSTPQSIGPR